MKGYPVKWALALTLLMGSAFAAADDALKVGVAAPKLNVAKWVKGQPITKFEPGMVYVVEFWATWCGPCKTSIPHLTELQKKYKGKAVFAGISVFEEQEPVDESYIPKVEKFVTEWGPKMDYTVAVDGKDGWMGKNWMEAAGQNGIPTAFVVDQKGTVAWIGHPMDRLDEVVGEVIAGKFDVKAEAARLAKIKADQEKAMAEVKPFLDALQQGDFVTAIAEMDKAFAKNPQLEQQFGMAKYQALVRTDMAGAGVYGRKLANTIYKDNPMALNSMAWLLIDDKAPLPLTDVKLAVDLAEKGVAALKPDQHMEAAYILDTLALAYFKDSQLDKAIANQEKALAAANKAPDFDADTLAEIKERLAMFKSKKG